VFAYFEFNRLLIAMINQYLSDFNLTNRPFLDELVHPNGKIAPQWQKVASVYEKMGIEKMRQHTDEVAQQLRENGVTYNIHGNPDGINRPWNLDPIPMIFSAQEWHKIEAGLIQRARILNYILGDLYGNRSLITNGLLPFELIYNHRGFLRTADKIKLDGPHQLIMSSCDLARGSNGAMWVLHDRVDAPSGAGYTFENRSAMTRIFPELIRENQVRKISQYFYPQKQTQVMNEGWATFWHYTILQHLYDEGIVSDRFMLEVLHSHTNVVSQPEYNSKYYSGINPYALGFAMFCDIRRICQQPTAEDKEWFPDLAGSDWLETLHFAMQNFKDESFISQYLSPKVIRDFHLFAIVDDDEDSSLEVAAIHNAEGYQKIRTLLSQQYNLSQIEPNIQVYNVDFNGDRSLTLRYIPQNRVPLAASQQQVLKHLHRLWGFTVYLEQQNDDGSTELLASCPEQGEL
jgi:hypothetical protein